MGELPVNPMTIVGEAPVAAGEIPFDAYWRLRMDGATSRLNAVREIVTHKPSRGTFAESLLREVIAEFLPQRYAAATGFIMDRPARSNQVDIIVYDQLTDSPVYRDGGFVILTPGAAKLVIEVKSELIGATKPSDNEIAGAFNNIRSVKRVDPNVRGFIFGYDGNQLGAFVKRVKSWASGPEAVPRTEWPDQVFNLNQAFAMVPTPGTAEGDGRLRDASTHSVYADPAVVRSFLTAALLAINLANVRGFLAADVVGEPIATF
jgi:hypothetical protein